MIKVNFFAENGLIKGFEISGHSGAGEVGNDIICASVSSAAYLVANTITDILELNCDIKVNDGYLKLIIIDDLSDAQQILKGLRLHLESLADDYPNNILVTRRCQNA